MKITGDCKCSRMLFGLDSGLAKMDRDAKITERFGGESSRTDLELEPGGRAYGLTPGAECGNTSTGYGGQSSLVKPAALFNTRISHSLGSGRINDSRPLYASAVGFPIEALALRTRIARGYGLSRPISHPRRLSGARLKGHARVAGVSLARDNLLRLHKAELRVIQVEKMGKGNNPDWNWKPEKMIPEVHAKQMQDKVDRWIIDEALRHEREEKQKRMAENTQVWLNEVNRRAHEERRQRKAEKRARQRENRRLKRERQKQARLYRATHLKVPDKSKFTGKESFLKSFEWKKLRYEILSKSDGRCQLCGRSAADGALLNVDHIKPRSKYPELALDPANLQVLCAMCNHGKYNLDETDWRREQTRLSSQDEEIIRELKDFV